MVSLEHLELLDALGELEQMDVLACLDLLEFLVPANMEQQVSQEDLDQTEDQEAQEYLDLRVLQEYKGLRVYPEVLVQLDQLERLALQEDLVTKEPLDCQEHQELDSLVLRVPRVTVELLGHLVILDSLEDPVGLEQLVLLDFLVPQVALDLWEGLEILVSLEELEQLVILESLDLQDDLGMAFLDVLDLKAQLGYLALRVGLALQDSKVPWEPLGQMASLETLDVMAVQAQEEILEIQGVRGVLVVLVDWDSLGQRDLQAEVDNQAVQDLLEFKEYWEEQDLQEVQDGKELQVLLVEMALGRLEILAPQDPPVLQVPKDQVDLLMKMNVE
jgi:hypothetical protein